MGSRSLTPVALALAFAAAVALADTVKLRDGKVLHGRKTADSAETIGFRTEDGKFLIIKKDDIAEFTKEEAPAPPHDGAAPKQPAQKPKPDAKKGLEAVLDKQTVTFDFVETPLDDALSVISKQAGVPILIDAGAPDVAAREITLRVNGFTLRKALDWVAKLAALKWVVQGNQIVVTTPERLFRFDEKLLRVYDIRDILKYYANEKWVCDTLQRNIRWYEELGTSFAIREGRLVVVHTEGVHKSVATTLESWRRPVPRFGNGDRSILSGKTVQGDFLKVMLPQIMREYSKQTGIVFTVDHNHLRNASQMGGLGDSRGPVESALWALCLLHRLDYVIKNGVVTVTTREGAIKLAEKRVKVYSTSDLNKVHSPAQLVGMLVLRVAPGTWGPAHGTSMEGTAGHLRVVHIDNVQQQVESHLRCLRMALKRGEKDYPH